MFRNFARAYLCKLHLAILILSINSVQSKKISNDQELIQSDPTPCPQNQKRNN